jgi:hypothetical protein
MSQQVTQPSPYEYMQQQHPQLQMYKNKGLYQHIANQPHVIRPTSRMLSPQHCIQEQQTYALPSGRDQHSQKKNAFFSPQINKDHYGIQPLHVKFAQEQKNLLEANQSKPKNFVGQPHFQPQLQPRTSDRAVNYNNRYYCTGGTERPTSFLPQPQALRPQLVDEPIIRRSGGFNRPHSTSRNSVDRLNLFSQLSPSESQL